MLRNFLNVLFRFRMASLLNITGLSVAYIALIVIGLQVLTEYSHDKMYPDSDRIYRIEIPSWGDRNLWMATLSRPMIDAVVLSSPEIESSAIVRFGYNRRNVDQKWDIQGRASGSDQIKSQVIRISEGFPEMFGMKIVSGEGLSDDPQKVIVPRSMAEQYFGQESPLGKVLSSYGKEVTINGVYEDFPMTSSFANNLYCNAGDDQAGIYNNMNYELFVKLRSGADTAAFVERLSRAANEANNAGRPGGATDTKFRILKFSDIYFAPDIYTGNIHVVNDTSKLKLFSLMALLIVFIAAINYINFAMALVPVRIRSINTRKIFGARTAQLRAQLVGEAVGMSLLAFLIALGVIVNFDTLDSISFIPTTVYVTANWIYLGYVGLLAVGLGLLAGLYPAYYSTSFRAAYVLKGSFSLLPQGRTLRTVLVGVQFVISIGLIVASMFMNLQFSMIRNADLGINKENILQLEAKDKLAQKIEELRSAISGMAGVKDITFLPEGCDIVADNYSTYAFGQEEQLRLNNIHGRSNMADFFGLEIIEGRNFVADDDLKAPNSVVLVNSAAQRKFNLKIGDRLGELHSVYNGYRFSDADAPWEVVGVVADFNFKPLYETVSPLMIANYGTSISQGNSKMYIKAKTDDYETLIDNITATAKELDPEWESNLSFLDEHIEQLYKDDLRSTSLIDWLSLLAIIISLSGVFGLVHFEVRYRRKEIGLRKINGATIGNVLALLSRKFIIMTIACYAIATPLAVYFVSEWLNTFAYRTPLYWWVFALAMVVMLTLISITVVIQSYRTARENPVNSIKTE